MGLGDKQKDTVVSAKALSNREIEFLRLANDPVSRPALLDRLAQLGELSAFLEAESGTM